MKPMSQSDLDAVVNAHFGYEANDDLEGVLSTLAEDAEHEVVGGPDGPLRGRAALRDFYQRLFPDLRGEGIEPITRYYGADFVVDVTLWKGYVVNGRPFMLDGMKGSARFRIMHQFELKNGLITKEIVWYDHVALAAQLTPIASPGGAEEITR